jgi:hypothetical protein
VTSSAEKVGAVPASVAEVIPSERIDSRIYLVRGQKVLLDRDLADLYGVETRILNRAVRRNSERFPEDFMFALTRREIERISQIGISSGSLRFSKSVLVGREIGFHTFTRSAVGKNPAKSAHRKAKH